MKKFFAGVIGSALIIAAMAQQRTPPPLPTAPPLPTPPPPAVPDFTPARPQPGVPAGGGSINVSRPPNGIIGPVRTNGTGVVTTPFPVAVPANTFPFWDPLAVLGSYDDLSSTTVTTPNAGTAQGRPSGLGVTITGGGASVPAGHGVTITGGNPNSPANNPAAVAPVPAITNTPPPLTNGTVTNSTYR